MPEEPSGAVNEGDQNRPSRGFMGRLKNSVEIALAICAVAAIVLGVKNWHESTIEKAVEKKLTDPYVLRKVAEYSRPALIFNGKGSILQDLGGVQFIRPDDIRVTERDGDMWIKKIHIGFVKPVSYPPIMTSMSESAYSAVAKRGTGLDWDFQIVWIVAPSNTNDEDRVFRLEIFP